MRWHKGKNESSPMAESPQTMRAERTTLHLYCSEETTLIKCVIPGQVF